MDAAIAIIKSFLGALLKLLELFVAFIVGALNIILDFARYVIGLIT